jgi:hypothetical protein
MEHLPLNIFGKAKIPIKTHRQIRKTGCRQQVFLFLQQENAHQFRFCSGFGTGYHRIYIKFQERVNLFIQRFCIHFAACHSYQMNPHLIGIDNL